MTEEREIKNWIEERRKGSDLMCKLFNRNKELKKENAELKEKLDKIRNYLANDIPHELMNEATNKIWRMV